MTGLSCFIGAPLSFIGAPFRFIGTPRRGAPVLFALLFLSACSRQEVADAGDRYATWATYGGTPEQIKYSSLRQITPANVNQLEVAWTFDPGDASERTIFQTTPILVDGLLYVASPAFRIYALNPATGEPVWKFDPYSDVIDGREPLGQSRLRGLMHWSDGTDSRVYGVVRNWLYALDAKTGKRVLGFGENGRVDLRKGLDRDPDTVSISASTPGVVFEDMLIMGSTVPESLPSAPGDIRAYDARTGEIRWTFHTIPRPGEFGYHTWPEGVWKMVGGANAWSGFSLDEKNGLLFFGTGSAAYDFYGANRAGDNLFANCIVALDVRTGERKWHFQTVKHDIWDRDLPAPPSLVTVEREGKAVEAVAQVTKSGHIFVLDRRSGKPLFPVKEMNVPASGMPGEQTSPTQLFPAVPEPLARQGLTRDMLTERTPQANRYVTDIFDRLDGGGVFAPPSLNGTAILPGFDGGGEWGGGTFDPETGLFYVNVNEMPWILKLVERQKGSATDARGLYLRHCAECHGENRAGSPPSFPALVGLEQRFDDQALRQLIKAGAGRMPAFSSKLNEQMLDALGQYLLHDNNPPLSDIAAQTDDGPGEYVPYVLKGYDRFLDDEGYPAIKPPWGTLNAIDLSSGQRVWQTRLGEYPALAEAGVPVTGSENYGGSVVTAGGLLFIAATKFDSKIRAFDKLTGKLLWQHDLPAPGTATPAVYESAGRQFIVIAAGAGGHTNPGAGSYIAFALPVGQNE